MIGSVVGHYRILERIGAGGMGVVYRAHDAHLDREVALKLLSATGPIEAADRRRFRKEALALSRINHPNIATVYDFIAHEGVDVLVMEYIPGVTLSERVAAGPLAEPEILKLALQLAEGLAAAHAEGVVHRDLKPQNLRVTPDGRLKILDFGLARFARPPTGSTTTHTLSEDPLRPAGTLAYMAPELLRAEEPDARSDIYGAGAVLYQIATGAPPFTERRHAPLIASILYDQPLAPSATSPSISAGLDAIVLKALDKDPERRYQAARELLVDIRRLAVPGSVVTPPRPRRRTRRWVLAATLILVGALAWPLAHRWSRPAVAFQEREWVLIADLDASGVEPQTALAVRSALDIALQQSSYVNVLPRDRVFEALRRMRREDATRIDETLGLEICRREGVRLLFAGTIVRSGGAFQIALRALDAATGALVFGLDEHVERSQDLFTHLDSVARQVRRQLGESFARIQDSSRPLERVTTASLEAIEAYSAAVDATARGDVDAAQALLDVALARDPDFAMAHRLVARVRFTKGDRERELAHLSQAYALRDQVTTRERYFIIASYYTVQGRYEQALQNLEALVRLFPDDVAAHGHLAIAYRNVGDLKKAVAALRNALALTPNDGTVYADLALTLARRGDNQEATEVSNEAVRRGLDSQRLRWSWGMALFGLGDLAGAREQFVRMQQAGGGFANVAALYLTRLAIYEGRFGEAARDLEADIRADERQSLRSPELVRRYLLARIFVERGERARARAEVERVLATGEPEPVQATDLLRVGAVATSLGDPALARRALARLDRLRRTYPTSFNDGCYNNLAGEIALSERRPRDALAAFSLAYRQYPGGFSTRGLARAAEALEDWTRAAAEWTRFLHTAGEVLQDGFSAEVPLAELALGRVHHRLNDVEQARVHYERFLTAWRDADDLPVRRAALRERGDLQTGRVP